MHTFTAGALARAEHVNENFTELLNKITALEQVVNHVNDGKIVINGVPYNATGTATNFPSFSYSTNSNGTFGGVFNMPHPYTPPPGWKFHWQVEGTTGFTLLVNVGNTSTHTILRPVQIANSGPTALQRLRYWLVKA